MTKPVYIMSEGARTPLGLKTCAIAAAVRAGITALAEHPFMVDQVGDPMPGAMDPELDPKFIGAERLVSLAQSALREACSPFVGGPQLNGPLPVYLGLPEIRPGFTALDAEAVRFGLTRFRNFPVQLSEPDIFVQGHSSGIAALSAATEKMRHGEFEACIVGGVDSYFHPDTMEWLDAHRQLAGAVSRSGFVPGEGAGFCLLMTDEASDRWELEPLAKVLTTAISRETNLIKTDEISIGDGLVMAVLDAVRFLDTPAERISDIICDINGERYRSEEWGFVCLRAGQYFNDATAYISPAECWGDMGAASGILFAMLACQAAARGHSKGQQAMLWASSEGGQRAAAVIETKSREHRNGH